MINLKLQQTVHNTHEQILNFRSDCSGDYFTLYGSLHESWLILGTTTQTITDSFTFDSFFSTGVASLALQRGLNMRKLSILRETAEKLIDEYYDSNEKY